VKAGQIVKVKVLSVDAKAKRVGLSIKALSAPLPRPAGKAAATPVTPRNEKFAAFLEKWNAQKK
jgi:uncharacterized protein